MAPHAGAALARPCSPRSPRSQPPGPCRQPWHLWAALLVASLAAGVAAEAQVAQESGQPTLAPSTASGCRDALAEFYAYNAKEAVPLSEESLLYFLHIPRTAGRTFHSCLLRLGTPGRRRCPKAYDHLRIDTDLPKCHLLSSHDDFSVVEKLPPNTAVVSQLRDPLDRLLSAYEFAIEVAARQTRRAKNYVKPKNRVVTDDVWPWSYLIPFFTDDIKPKVEAAKAVPLQAPGVWSEQRTDEGKLYYWNQYQNLSKWTLDEADKATLVPSLDPYDNHLYMPLKEFIRSPEAHELLHNGEVLQVLGLTNYSHWPRAAELRRCMRSDAAVADELLAFALKRVERFTHVGTTDQLIPSVEAAAAGLNMPLKGPAYGAGEAPNANAEGARALTWEQAMQLGAQPLTPASDEFYAETAAKADIHQLAADVRRKRGAVSERKARWNAAVQAGEPQARLRKLRGELIGARAELAEAQALLVSERSEEAHKRALREQALTEDKRLDMNLGAEFDRCAKRAQARNQQRKKNSLLNLRLPDYRTVYFSKDDRRAIPAALLEEMWQLNSLDVALHKHALQLLAQRRAALEASGQLVPLDEAIAVSPPAKASGVAEPQPPPQQQPPQHSRPFQQAGGQLQQPPGGREELSVG